jgi:hypothetical protein
MLYSSRFGFFLHPERFMHALKQMGSGSSNPSMRTLSPALMSSMALWGLHLSPSFVPLESEQRYLRLTLEQLSAETLTISSGQLTHLVQTEVLLTHYFLRNGRFYEAELHVNSAVSLLLAHDAHKIRSSRPYSSTLLGVVGKQEILPSSSKDLIEEGERINAFWTAFCLERTVMLTLRNPVQTFGFITTPCVDIDTPWPLDVIDYVDVRLNSGCLVLFS